MSFKDDYSLELRTSLKNELNDMEFIQLRYTDVLGKFLAKYIYNDKNQIYDCIEKGIGVDGSSIRGFATIDESDLLLLPDRSTLHVLPLTEYRVGTVICDVFDGFGKGRLIKDPRHVSQRLEEYLSQSGIICYVGPEVECFIFDDIVFQAPEKNDSKTKSKLISPNIVSIEAQGIGKYPLKIKGGYDAPPFQDSLMEFRFEIARILEKYYSIRVTNLNHEVASNGQIEINFIHSTLTRAADNVQIFKDVVRNVAKHHNKIANFMAKPIFDENDFTIGDNGSGMHVSVSLWNSAKQNNLFYDASDPYAEISQDARYFIGGILEHASAISAFANPTVNSYRRIIPGFEAPVYVTWSRGNRSAVVRVPINDRKNPHSKRMEFRAPDPSANPYLTFSAIVSAGLDGIKHKIESGDPVNENIYKMSDKARRERGIKSLPGNLNEALEALGQDSEFLKVCFNDDLIRTYLDLKRKEAGEISLNSKFQQFDRYYDV